MFNEYNDMLNAICMVSMTLVFLVPDGTIGDDDMADHNNLYNQFAYGQSVSAAGTFAMHLQGMYEEEEEFFQ